MSSKLSYDYPGPRSSSQSHRNSSYNTSCGQPAPLHPLYHEAQGDVDEPFDVRADFDGEGPRWSERHGKVERDIGDRWSYRPVDQHVPPASHDPKSAASGDELVSVPVLGPEWQKSELHALSKRGMAEERRDKRTRAWREWTRDQRGTCGVRWLTRKLLVFVLFVICAGLAVTLYFVIPRPPSFQFYVPTPFIVDNSTLAFSRTPTNFSFAGQLNLLADTSSSYLPTHFSDISVTLYDLNTDLVIALGNYGNHVVPKGQNQPIVIPVEFSYAATNASDTTWNDVYNACGHLWPGTTRPDLKFRLVLQSSIVGLVTHPEASTELNDITCPFQLPTNSV